MNGCNAWMCTCAHARPRPHVSAPRALPARTSCDRPFLSGARRCATACPPCTAQRRWVVGWWRHWGWAGWGGAGAVAPGCTAQGVGQWNGRLPALAALAACLVAWFVVTRCPSLDQRRGGVQVESALAACGLDVDARAQVGGWVGGWGGGWSRMAAPHAPCTTPEPLTDRPSAYHAQSPSCSWSSTSSLVAFPPVQFRGAP